MKNRLEPPEWNYRDVDRMSRDDVFPHTLEPTSFLSSSKKIFFILIAISSVQTLTACSMEAAIQSLEEKRAEVMQSKASNNELVPASQQGVVTAQGYRVQSSFSFQTSKPEIVTSKGYKVYTNVQSTLFKE